MKAVQVEIGFPVLRLECEASITMRGPPTAFERMILSMRDRLASNQIYNGIPIVNLFRDFLGVADPNRMLASTMTDLIGIDVLRYVNGEKAIEAVCLNDVEITDRGRTILKDGRLPAVARVFDLEMYYDPIAQRRIWHRPPSGLAESPPGIHLASRLLEDAWPEEEVRKAFELLQEQRTVGRLSVEKIQPRGRETLWRAVEAGISLSGGRFQIHIEKPGNEALDSYLKHLPDQTILDRVLIPALIGTDLGNEAMSRWGTADPIDAESLTDSWRAISELATEGMREATVVMLDKESGPYKRVPEPSEGQLIVLFGQHFRGSEVEFNWRQDRSGCLITINRSYPFKNTLLATAKAVVRVGLVRVQGSQGSYRFPLAIFDDGSEAADQIRSARAEIVALLEKNRPEDLQRTMKFWPSVACRRDAASSIGDR